MHVGDYQASMRFLHGPNVALFAEAQRRDRERREQEAAARVAWGPRKEALHGAMIDAFYAAGLAQPFPPEPATEEERRLRDEYQAARAAWEQCPAGD
jgi:hypothetical protein